MHVHGQATWRTLGRHSTGVGGGLAAPPNSRRLGCSSLLATLDCLPRLVELYFRGYVVLDISRSCDLPPLLAAALSNYSHGSQNSPPPIPKPSLADTWLSFSVHPVEAALAPPVSIAYRLGLGDYKAGRFHSLFFPTQPTLPLAHLMSAVTVMVMPVRLAALLFCFAVISLFAASGAIGWYFVWGESSSMFLRWNSF